MPKESCSVWSKSGTCKYGDNCKFRHGIPHSERGVRAERYTEHGLPLRPGIKICNIYNRTGRCPYGVACKFDHSFPYWKDGGGKSPTGPISRTHLHPQQRYRRIQGQEMRRYLPKSFYPDPGRINSSKGWQSAGSETSPRPYTDGSPRSTNDVNGSFNQSCSPQSTHPASQASPLPQVDASVPCYTDSSGGGGGHNTQDSFQNGQNLANLFQQNLEQHQKGNALTSHIFHPEYLTWPLIPSHWYQPGVPNQVMQTKIDKERDPTAQQHPMTPLHFLKPFREPEGTFLQVGPFQPSPLTRSSHLFVYGNSSRCGYTQ